MHHGGIRSPNVGSDLRRLREERGLSLVAAGRLTAFSKSSLQRMELGHRDVTPEDVAQLEVGLGLDGMLAVAYHRELMIRSANHLEPATLWVHSFPAKWSGPVWAFIRTKRAGTSVGASLLWGSWSRRVEVTPDGTSIGLVFGKGNDGESVPLSLSVEPACVVSFGFGPPVDDDWIDINDGWLYGANESEALRRVGAAFLAMLRKRGRALVDLAELLGTSEHELRNVLHIVEAENSVASTRPGATGEHEA